MKANKDDLNEVQDTGYADSLPQDGSSTPAIERSEAAWTGAIVGGAMGLLYGPPLVGSFWWGVVVALCLSVAGYLAGRCLDASLIGLNANRPTIRRLIRVWFLLGVVANSIKSDRHASRHRPSSSPVQSAADTSQLGLATSTLGIAANTTRLTVPEDRNRLRNSYARQTGKLMTGRR